MLMRVVHASKGSVKGRNAYKHYTEDVEDRGHHTCVILWQNLSDNLRKTTKCLIRIASSLAKAEKCKVRNTKVKCYHCQPIPITPNKLSKSLTNTAQNVVILLVSGYEH